MNVNNQFQPKDFFPDPLPSQNVNLTEKEVSIMRDEMEWRGLSEEIIELSLSVPQDDIGDRWQNYVILRKSDWAAKFYNNSNQEEYGKWMHHSIKIASKGIKEKNWKVKDVLTFLEYRRNKIAIILDAPNAGVIGYKRTKIMDTGCVDVYKDIILAFDQLSPDGEKIVEQPLSELRKSLGAKRELLIQAEIDHKLIPLSEIEILEKPQSIKYLYKGLPCYGTVTHPKPEVAHIVMDYVKNVLYEKALNESDPDKLIEDLGRIFWWICQAKPWIFSDPSIAESFIRAIWAAKGFENPSWKEDIVPWVEVLKEPDVDNFAKNFHKLFA